MFKDLPAAAHIAIFVVLAYLFMELLPFIFWASIATSVDLSTLEADDYGQPKFYLAYALFFQVFTFLLSFMLILRLMGKRFTEIVYIDKLTINHTIITILIFIGGMYIMGFLDVINALFTDYIPVGALENEAATNATQHALIFESNPIQLVFTLLIVAVLPAICEELVFRGFLMKKMIESGLARNGAIFFSALIFAIIHFQPLKLLPMLFLGCCLGFVYSYFKNIKYAILLHFLVNGSQVIVGYYVGHELM